MALTPDQLAYWEASPQDFPLFMYVHSPTTVFAARVNQTAFPNPLMEVTFDTVTTGAFGDIKEGMTILFGSTAGGDDLGRLPVRLNSDGDVSDATTIFVQRASHGVGDGEASLADNAYITVLDQYLVWSTAPYITDAGVVYKNGEIGFNQATQQRPKPNAGADVLKIVNDGVTSATVSFDGSTSSLWNPAASSFVAIDWDFGDGTPSSSTSITPGNVSFPIGKRYISLSLVDDEGAFRTARALVVVAQRDDPDLIHYWDAESWTERVDGQDIRIRVHQPLSYADYPDGTEVLICTSENADQVGLAGREHMLFSGWLHDEVNRVEASQQGLVSRLTFQLLDVAGRLKILHQFPESVDRESGASSWAQMIGLNPDRLAHYSLDWHSTAFARVDYIGAGQLDTYAIRGLEIGGDSLFSGVSFIAGAMGYLFTCDINNRLILRQDPQLAPTAAQNTLLSVGFSRSIAETLTLEPKHWQNYEYSFKRMPRVHFNWGETLITSIANMSSTSEIQTAFVAAPGLTPGQGASESNTTRQVSRNVAEIKMRVGNLYRARQNALTENFQFELNPMRHALHPANVEWFEASIASAQSGYRGRVITAERFLPIEINYRTDVSKRIRRATVAVEREVTNGTPATQYTPASTIGTNWSYNLPDISLGDWVYEPINPSPIPPWTDELPVSGIILSASEPKAARMVSFDFGTSTVTYVDMSTGLIEPSIWFRSDPFNYSAGYNLAEDGLYYMADQSVGGTWTLVADNAEMFGNSARRGYKLLMSHLRRGWIMALSGDSGAGVSFDYGATWTQVAIDGGTPSWSTSVGRGGDVALAPRNANHLYSLVQSGTADIHDLYQSVNGGLTWALVSSTVSNGGGSASPMNLEIGYTRVGGAANTDDADLELYATSLSGGFQSRLSRSTDGGLTWTGVQGTIGDNRATHSLCGSPLNIFTHDGIYQHFMRRTNALDNADLYYTDDDYTSVISWFGVGNGVIPNAMVNGWSMNPLVAVGFTRVYRYAFTLNGGVTVITPNMPSGWADGVAYVEFSLYPFQ